MKICVVGAGTWATALCQVLVDNGHEAIMYSKHENQVDEINSMHTNARYFGHEIILSKKLHATLSLKECVSDAHFILFAVPSQAIKSCLLQTIPLLTNKVVFINAAKGFDPETNERISDVIRNTVPNELNNGVVSLIGPGHAEEVILRLLTLVTATSLDIEKAQEVQQLFSNDYFRVYTNTDEVGAEYGVSIKNCIAIASGILEGLGYGDNARAALVTRGLHEMVRFGAVFGGKEMTYLGLTGLGDLMVTCNSHHSRNFRAGVQIGRDDCAEFFLEHNIETTEGVRTTKVIHEIAKEKGIYMPIVEAIYEVLYMNARPSEMIKKLMISPLRAEED